MTEPFEDLPFRTRLRFERQMRDLPDVASTLAAVDELWVGSYDFAMLAAFAGLGIGLEGETLHFRDGSHEDFAFATEGLQDAQSGRGPRFDVPRPTPTFISMRSPLIVELVETYFLPTGIGASTFAFFRWSLKNPGALGRLLPDFLDGWNSGWARVSRSRVERVRARDEAAQFLAARKDARRGHEIAGRVIDAGHRLSDAGLEVVRMDEDTEEGEIR